MGAAVEARARYGRASSVQRDLASTGLSRPGLAEYHDPATNPVRSTRRIPIEIKDNGSKKFVIGVAVTHVYGIEVMADTHDHALLNMDSWLRGNLPAKALTAKIRSSDVKVIGLGSVAYGRVSEVGELSSATREEMAARGKLPETSLHHLLPLPPSDVAPISAKVERGGEGS